MQIIRKRGIFETRKNIKQNAVAIFYFISFQLLLQKTRPEGYHKRTASTDTGVLRVGPNMLNKMIREQQKHLKRAAERQKLKEKGAVNKPIRLSFEDTTKTKAFNRLFQQNLLLVLHSPSFSEYFLNSGLTITKVSI